MKNLFLSFSLVLASAPAISQMQAISPVETSQKTTFQTSSAWIPEIDVRSDVAIIYGANDRNGLTFENRVKSWQQRGYTTQFMTGIAWGQYPDYFLGNWDGQNHLGVGQVNQKGDTIWHGKNMPYIVPVNSFIEYMKTRVIKKVIDAGITTIYLEEPEFWARAGYSQPFRQEWEKFYGYPWKDQAASPANTYLSNKLKYHLYYRAISEVSAFAKKYGREQHKDIKVFIATHSLVNYASWRIVSPEASLASLPGIDGYIAQVWTGTAREPVYFNGEKKERVFENAFLEYGSMVSMTAPTGRTIYFLTDPIEDRARDWSDYKRNYEATFTAKLLYPGVDHYEVMPWPERIYTHKYKLAGSDSAVLIPRYYSTQVQIMIDCLNRTPRVANRVSGPAGITVLMGNSMMFQRYPEHNSYADPQFSNFYGQTMPLLEMGIPVQTQHLENLSYPAALKDTRVLVMSYANMKPMLPEAHASIAAWVKKGGVLVYCGKDDDPYQSVPEWWNTGRHSYSSPSAHLFAMMNIKPPLRNERFKYGRGTVYVIRDDPKNFVMQPGGAEAYTRIIRQAYEDDASAGKLAASNHFYLQRGPYDIVSVLDSGTNSKPYSLDGLFIDLYDPQLPVVTRKTVLPGQQALLYTVKRIKDKHRPQVLAAACRVYAENTSGSQYRFTAKGPLHTTNHMRVLLPAKPVKITLANNEGQEVLADAGLWDANSHTWFLSAENNPEGMTITFNW